MKKFAKISLVFLTCVASVMLLIAGSIFVYLNFSKNNVKFDKDMLIAQNSTIDIYNQQNEKINAKTGKKAIIKYDELPKYVVDAFVSIEDKDFYKHKGLNYKRIAKAFVNNLKSRSLKEGASTISQQLIKNTHLSTKKTIARKLNEMALAKELEKNFSKDEIMETYLNVIYFGSGAKGLENASEIYFDKPATELTIAQSAMLAGLIKSPKTYSPIFNLQNCIKRRNLVLQEMLKDGKITQDEYQNAIVSSIEISTSSKVAKRNFYEEATLLEAENLLGIDENQIALHGYKIFTYQDNTDQNAVHNAINNKDFYAQNRNGFMADGIATMIDNKTGGVCAFDAKSIYDVISMKRSPGSSIKPILVYAPALENGIISPSSMILDQKQKFGNYAPQNVGDTYYGWISATKSVEKSLNIPAIKIMQANGIENCKKMAMNCGIQFADDDRNLAIALGGMTNGTNILQLANTYVPFANNGKFVKAKFIKKICDTNGKIIYQNNENQNQVMSPETAYLMTDMLKSGVKHGTSYRLHDLPFEIAGKTGTVGVKGTNLNTDVWSVAYTPQKTTCVWLGDSEMTSDRYLEGSNNGGTFATSIVKNIFENSNIDKSAKFEKPSGIVECQIDSITLEKEHRILLASPQTPDRYKTSAIFNKKYAPTISAEKFSKARLCEISASIQDDYPKIVCDTLCGAKYKLYKIEEDKRTLLCQFDGDGNKFEFVDTSAQNDTTYQYFVETTYGNETNKSSSIFVTTKSSFAGSFKKLLESW